MAVNVTDCPNAEGFDEEAIVVAELSGVPILATKASKLPPPNVGCKGFIVGKLVEDVKPAT
jgi:hypothetical protein